MRPLRAVLSITEIAVLSAASAVSLFSAMRTRLMAVRMREVMALLRACALKLLRSLFFADFSVGTLALL